MSERTQPEGRVTLRSIVIGLCIAMAMSLLACTARYIQKGSYMMVAQIPMGVLLLCLVSILACAVLARRFGAAFVLAPSEWITVFSMGVISAIGPNYGVSGYLVGMMASPYYFATPENRWAEYLHPHLPGWLIPTNDNRAMSWFYEGLPGQTSVPWDVWGLPLIWWLSFVFVLGFACICLSVLLHRQWADHEKLVYPALAPVLEMTSRAGTGRRWLPEFMTGKVFWAGFALTSIVFWWNMIAWFYPMVPSFPTATGRFIWDLLPKEYPPFFVFLSTPVICFSYFASLDVLFSIWFFDFVYMIEAGALNRIGISATSPHYGAGPYTTTTYKWQTAGAFVSLVLWWLWISRRHLQQVLQKALHPGRSSVDDGRELLSYRAALIGLLASCVYIAAFLGRVGVEARMVALLIPTMFIAYLFVAKVVADSGIIYIQPPASAWELSGALVGGAKTLNASTRATYGLLSFTISHPRSFIMPLVAQINRLGDFVGRDKRRLFWGVFAALVVGVVSSTLYTIWLGYHMGAYNFQPNWLIIYEGEWQYGMTVNEILNPARMEAIDYWFLLIGAGTMVIVNLMRYRFARWPVHPIGFALSGLPAARRMGSTLLVAWLTKLIMLRAGGVAFYRRSMPFFLGMLVGYIIAVMAGMLVDAIWFPNRGHVVHKWY